MTSDAWEAIRIETVAIMTAIRRNDGREVGIVLAFRATSTNATIINA